MPLAASRRAEATSFAMKLPLIAICACRSGDRNTRPSLLTGGGSIDQPLGTSAIAPNRVAVKVRHSAACVVTAASREMYKQEKPTLMGSAMLFSRDRCRGHEAPSLSCGCLRQSGFSTALIRPVSWLQRNQLGICALGFGLVVDVPSLTVTPTPAPSANASSGATDQVLPSCRMAEHRLAWHAPRSDSSTDPGCLDPTPDHRQGISGTSCSR